MSRGLKARLSYLFRENYSNTLQPSTKVLARCDKLIFSLQFVLSWYIWYTSSPLKLSVKTSEFLKELLQGYSNCMGKKSRKGGHGEISALEGIREREISVVNLTEESLHEVLSAKSNEKGSW